MLLVNSTSSKHVKEIEATKYYLTPSNKIYSDKLSKFVVKCNEASKNKLINRIAKIFQNIYIDEVQDLAGYDLDILLLLFKSSSKIILAGDPRQTIYLTHQEQKFKKYKLANIINFFEKCKSMVEINLEIDNETLNTSFRCNEKICEYAYELNKSFSKTTSKCDVKNMKHGVFLIKPSDSDEYLKNFKAIQLRYNRKSKYNENFPVYNFGEVKGFTFDNILIYPTKEITQWIENHSTKLKEVSRARFYVALTRTRYNVCIFWEKDDCNARDIMFWET